MLNIRKSKWNTETIQPVLQKFNLTILEPFISPKHKFHCVDNRGYHYMCSIYDLNQGKIPQPFSSKNPYTLQNINLYLKNQNYNIELLSHEYINNHALMQWKCKCGNTFTATWDSILCGHRDRCPQCRVKNRSNDRRLSKLDIDTLLINYKVLSYPTSNTYQEKIDIEDSEGYRYSCYIGSICKGFKPLKFHNGNKFSIFNINHWLTLHDRREYVCVAKQYINNEEPLEFIHLPCNTHFFASLIQMKDKKKSNNKDYRLTQCPNCYRKKRESLHAAILKQICIHEYPNSTVLEDPSCINPKTNHTLPTDIVIHELKIAIEIQSSFHDSETQKQLDSFKHQYWSDQGYTVLAPDIRRYSIIEMIHLIFPNINEIPKYVDIHYNDCPDIKVIQAMLNDGKTLKQISESLNLTQSALQGMVHRKVIELPDGYKKKIRHQKKIVQLTLDNEYVHTFESYTDLDRHGYKNGTIRRVLNGNQKQSYGYHWMFEKDYLNTKT